MEDEKQTRIPQPHPKNSAECTNTGFAESKPSKRVEITVNYTTHSLDEVTGLPDGTELRLRDYDCNNGWCLMIYAIRGGSLEHVACKIECGICGGVGKGHDAAVDADEDGNCIYCNGTGFEQR